MSPPPSARRQNEALTTATGAAPRRESSDTNTRPLSGDAPSTRKKSPVTRYASARVGSSPPSTVVGPPRNVAMTEKLRASVCQSRKFGIDTRRTVGRRRDLPERDEPLGRGIRERPQQHGVDDGEDRGRRTDPDGERAQREDGEHGIAAQRAPRHADVTIEPGEHVRLSAFCSRVVRHRVELLFRNRAGGGTVRRHRWFVERYSARNATIGSGLSRRLARNLGTIRDRAGRFRRGQQVSKSHLGYEAWDSCLMTPTDLLAHVELDRRAAMAGQLRQITRLWRLIRAATP